MSGVIPDDPSKITGPDIGNWTQEWTQYFLDNRYTEIDPTLQVEGPVSSWDIAEPGPVESGEFDEFLADTREAGMHRGLIFSTRLGPDERLMMSITGEEKDVGKPDPQAMHLLAVACWMRSRQLSLLFQKFGGVEEGAPLTDRERDCLRWTALGKTVSEIADIIGISERTVRFHVGNAKRKLDCESTNLAVTKAIVAGLLSF